MPTDGAATGETDMFGPHLMRGRSAVVTAAAGAIGAATAELMVRAGGSVICVDRDADRLRAVVGRLGVAARAVVADVTTEAGLTRVVDAAGEEGPDVLINGVGEHLGVAGPFEDSDPVDWQRLYEVNLGSVLRLSHAFIPAMKARGWGRIVNFSSVEGRRAAPHLAVYAAMKHAIEAFTASIGVDLARAGIVVTCVAVDKTRAHQTGYYELPPEYAAQVPNWIPAGHYADGVEVARLVTFLASPLNTWVVGQTVVADGGTTAAGGWLRTPVRWTNQPLLAQYLEDPAVNATRPKSVQ
jgi:NAD(P)-dependent dehydrogenase (short-subunit alcohol dehydrogenase family)